MIRAIIRHFREAFYGMTRHFANSLSSAIAVTLTLLLMSVLLLIVGNISQITVDLQESVSIFVRVDENVSEENIPSLQNVIERIDGVGTVTYSDKDNELNKLIKEYGDDGYMFEIYRGENNPLSRAFVVTILADYSISEVSGRIGAVQGVSEALFGGSSTEDFIKTLGMIRNAGGIIILALGILAIFQISNTIKITINSRQREISIMRQVGATNGYIRTPFVLEGIFIGVIGSILPIVFTILGYRYLYEILNGQLVSGLLPLQEVFPFTLYVSAILLGMSVFVGLVGSAFAVNKNLRWKR